MQRFFKIGGFLAGVIVLLGITQTASAHGPSHGGMHSMGHSSSPSGHSHFNYAGSHGPSHGKYFNYNKGYGYGYGYGKGWPYYGKNWYGYGRYFGYGYYPSYYSYCPECYSYSEPSYTYPVYAPPAPCASGLASCTPFGAGAATVSDDGAPGPSIPPAPVVIENNASAGNGVPPLLARQPEGIRR